MTVENMNGIDVPALNAFVNRVKTDPDQRTVTFKGKTECKGQTKTITSISDYTLGDKRYSRDFQIPADEPYDLRREHSPKSAGASDGRPERLFVGRVCSKRCGDGNTTGKTYPNFSNFATSIRMIPNLVLDNS
jgi:hypothetical protein